MGLHNVYSVKISQDNNIQRLLQQKPDMAMETISNDDVNQFFAKYYKRK